MSKPQLKSKNLFANVYKMVGKIPPGKVATYGQIAEKIGTKDARKVGWAMHANSDLDCPCHRVVDRNGRLAPNFAFNGAKEQHRRLEAEGVTFKDEMHLDLEKHRWTPT